MYTDEMYHAAYNILSTRAEQLDKNELYHHGILGQKWGVRRYQNEDGSVTPAGAKRYYVNGVDGTEGLTKEGQKWKDSQNRLNKYMNKDGSLTSKGSKKYGRMVGEGDSVRIYERNPYGINKLLNKDSKSGKYEIYNKEGKRVGQIYADDYEDNGGRIHKNTEYIDWIGIDNKYQRKGYGKEALDLYLNDCTNRGKEFVRLEAAGMDPAARHIYEKRGFKVVGKTIEDPAWKSLTPMKLKLNQNN